jgi:hypothetical protein
VGAHSLESCNCCLSMERTCTSGRVGRHTRWLIRLDNSKLRNCCWSMARRRNRWFWWARITSALLYASFGMFYAIASCCSTEGIATPCNMHTVLLLFALLKAAALVFAPTRDARRSHLIVSKQQTRASRGRNNFKKLIPWELVLTNSERVVTLHKITGTAIG